MAFFAVTVISCNFVRALRNLSEGVARFPSRRLGCSAAQRLRLGVSSASVVLRTMGLFSAKKAAPPAPPPANVPSKQKQDKSKEEKDARAKGANNGAFIGTIIAGPVGGVIGGVMGAAAEAKKEREDFEKGGHERHADTTGAKVTRAAKGVGGMFFRAGL